MINKEAPLFEHSLSLKLALECEGTTVELLAGNIERVDIALHSYGFDGTLEFSGCNNEELLALMNLKKPIYVALTFVSSTSEPLLELKGIVIARESQRTDNANDNAEGPQMYYKVVIYDNARATWEETGTRRAYVDKSMKDAVEEHKNPDITLKYDFPPIEEKKPVIAFNLEYDKSLPCTKQSDFYSLVNWYLHLEGGIFSYDYKEHEYSILTKKPPEKGAPYKIREHWVAAPNSKLPAFARYSTRISKPTPQAIDSEDKENEDGFKGVRKDFISHESYMHDPGLAREEVKSPLHASLPELTVLTLLFEEDFHIDKLIPGSYVEFISDSKSWSSDHKGKVYRCRSLSFKAFKIDPSNDHKPTQKYQIRAESILEEKEEVFIPRPTFYPPKFPFEEDGIVFSDVGEQARSTFKLSDGEKTPKGHYSVLVPLAENEKVIIPFTPNGSGKKFEPYTKNQPVKLAMYFRAALILYPTDYVDHVALAKGIQGCQHVLSSSGPNIYDILKQILEDGKKSTVSFEQSTSMLQIQSITSKEKEIVIKVETKGAKVATICIHSEQGVSVTYTDKGSKHTQELLLDGKQAKIICKNESKTSFITLTPEATIINSENLLVTGKKAIFDFEDVINMKGASKINFESPLLNAKVKMKVGG